MKFVLGATSLIRWPIVVRRPDPDRPGRTLRQELIASFQPVEQDAFLEEQERIVEIPGMRARAAAERDYLASLIKGWEGPEFVDGTPVPFTPENLAEALQDGAFRAGAYQALAEIAVGQEARLGN